MSRLSATLRKHWLGLLASIAILVTAALVAVSMTNGGQSASPSSNSSASNSAAPGAFQQLGAANLGVSASGQLSKGMTAVAAPSSTSKPPFTGGLSPLSNVSRITPAGKLAHTITLRFKLSSPVKSPDTVAIATSETGTTGSWTLLGTTPAGNQKKPSVTLSADGMYAYVTTSELSFWQPFKVSASAVLDAFKDAIKSTISGFTSNETTSATAPVCNNQSQLKQVGYNLNVSGSSLPVCLGMQNGKPVLETVNARRYPLEIARSSGLSAPHTSGDGIDLSMLARLASGQNTIMGPFSQADFPLSLQPGGSAAVSATYSGLAQALYQLQFGIEAATSVLGRFGAGGGVIANGKITMSSFDVIAERVDKMLSYTNCFNAIKSANVGSVISSCFSAAQIMDAFGWRGVLLAPVMVLSSFISFFHSEFNALGDQLNGRSNTRVVVTRTKVVAPPKPAGMFADYVGVWGKHESTFTVKPNGSAVLVYRDYTCDIGPGGVNLNKCFVTIKWQLSPEDGYMLALETSDPRVAVGLSKKSADVLIMHADPGVLKSYQGDLPYCRAGSAVAKDGTQCG